MGDFLVAIGLVFAIEGLLFAAFPAIAKRAMAHVLETPDSALRLIGIAVGGDRRCRWSGWCAAEAMALRVAFPAAIRRLMAVCADTCLASLRARMHCHANPSFQENRRPWPA